MKAPRKTVYFFFALVYNVRMRLWAKLMKKDKIEQQFVYEKSESITYSQFFHYVADICLSLDIPTPVVAKTHIFHFAKYNYVKFTARDFVEYLPADSLVIENLR